MERGKHNCQNTSCFSLCVWQEAHEYIWREKPEIMWSLILKTQYPLFLIPAWYYGFLENTVCMCIFHFYDIELDFLIFCMWPATFWEHTVHMFWCCLKALWETRVDWKLSDLLKWVAAELEWNSCHTPSELLSFINYFPCHLEQEWCRGLATLFVGCIHIQCLYNLLITTCN